MGGILPWAPSGPGLELAALATLAAGLVVLAVWIVLQVRERSPEYRERKRRQFLHQRGRLGEAFITEATDSIIYYAYSVHGVQYTASQDITRLASYIPPDLVVSGPVLVRYDARNPANSIVVAERWSGLRASKVG